MDLVRAKDSEDWRQWLSDNHASSEEVWLVFNKKHTKKPSVSYDEAVEEALCYGWIDSIVRRIDGDSYAQKFTPRKRGSKWSESNLSRMRRLIREGRVQRPGMEVYLKRSDEKPDAERPRHEPERLPAEFEEALRRNVDAWKNFQNCPPSHRRQYVLWVTNAKRADTRQRRIAEAVKMIEKAARPLSK